MVQWLEANIGFISSLLTVAGLICTFLIFVIKLMQKHAMQQLQETLQPKFDNLDVKFKVIEGRLELGEKAYERLDERIHIMKEDNKNLWNQINTIANRIEQIYQILLKRNSGGGT